jgi:hypothetical protein
MDELAYGLIVFGFLFLGYRLYVKLRAIAMWNDKERTESGTSQRSISAGSIDLMIEEPDNNIGSIDETPDKPVQP